MIICTCEKYEFAKTFLLRNILASLIVQISRRIRPSRQASMIQISYMFKMNIMKVRMITHYTFFCTEFLLNDIICKT